MRIKTEITGVILAGDRASRMGGQDKGLLLLHNQPLLNYAVAAMRPLADELLVSANRNLDAYRRFGYPVLADANSNFDGPLAGILTALRHAGEGRVLLTMPCDMPLLQTAHLRALLDGLQQSGAACCVAHANGRPQPVLLALQTALTGHLAAFLAAGERKIGLWLQSIDAQPVAFADPAAFANINTPADLAWLETHGAARL